MPERKRTPWWREGMKPLDQWRAVRGWSVLLPLPWEIMTMKAGRLAFSEPRP